MAGGLAQRTQPLRKCRSIGNRGGALQPTHDLLRIGTERFDEIAEKTLLPAQFSQGLDAALIDDLHGAPRGIEPCEVIEGGVAIANP